MDSVLVKENIYNRVVVSFGGRCPYACKHCYTFIPEYKHDAENNIDLIVQQLKQTKHEFENKQTPLNIVYLSGHKENFVNQDDGIELCEKIYEAVHCDILFTTRNCFSDTHADRISKLKELMKSNGHDLFACISIPALQSYKKIENVSIIPTPEERMNSLKKLYDRNIYTLLTVRPLFHDAFIPVQEPLEIINRCSEFSSAVLTSGLITNSYISKALNYPANQKTIKKEIMKCLDQKDIIVEYCDVTNELKVIDDFCSQRNIPLFCELNTKSSSISLEAVDYLKTSHARKE